jgi:hypothetical protein
MDIVYILGTGSTWNDNEIRFSLRSVEKNVKDFGRVFIVGELPVWLKNVEHIVCPDAFGIKWRNAYTKILKVCWEEKLSDDFLLMNDDFFIFKEIVASEYPYYFSSVLSKDASYNKAKFMTTPQKTASVLPRRVENVRNFAVHRPCRFNKKKYLEMPRFDLNMTGFSPRSFYCNFYNVPGVQCTDITLSPLLAEKDFEKVIANRTDISIFSNTARSLIFQNWIRKKFPEPSRFEK